MKLNDLLMDLVFLKDPVNTDSIVIIVFDIKNFLRREIAEMMEKTNQKKILSNTMYTYKYRKIITQFETISFLPLFYLGALLFHIT